MGVDNGKFIEVKESSSECPEFVYINLPLKFAPVILTAPNKHTNLYSTPVLKPSDSNDEVVIRMRNNGQWRVKPISSNQDILDEITKREALHKILIDFLGTTDLIKISREEFLSVLNSLDPEDSENSYVKAVIQNCIRGEGEMSVNDFNAQMEIEEVCYKGQCVPFDRINEIQPQVEQDMGVFEMIMEASELKRGDYLYRAPDRGEWRCILKDEAFIVRDRTNFEKEIGPQVSDYAKAEGYAGKIIRIKVVGPYFKHAGFNPPRIESIVAHFAEVEILIDGEKNEWVSLEEYKRKMGSEL